MSDEPAPPASWSLRAVAAAYRVETRLNRTLSDRARRRGWTTVALGYPVLQALSRKDFIGETLDLDADDRLEGTLASTAVAAWLGVTVFRAHDVRATRRVLDMVAAIRGDRPPARALRGVADPR